MGVTALQTFHIPNDRMVVLLAVISFFFNSIRPSSQHKRKTKNFSSKLILLNNNLLCFSTKKLPICGIDICFFRKYIYNPKIFFHHLLI